MQMGNMFPLPHHQGLELNIARIIALLALGASLFGCGNPVPPEKAAYVGEWQAKTVYLLITADGSVRYKRLRGGATTSIDGPLKGFVGNDFEAGIGPLATTFVVSKPPYQDGEQWKMVVDDVELTRSEE